jgi:hypothetical protein
MNRWTVWIVTLVIFILHTNVKFRAIFKINIFNLNFFHVVINFNGDHHKKFG